MKTASPFDGKQCPSCAALGVVVFGQGEGVGDGMFRMVCTRCGRATDRFLSFPDAQKAWDLDLTREVPRQILLNHLLLSELSILPCATCGGGHSKGELCIYSYRDGAAVWCRDCEDGTGVEPDQARAIEAWNAKQRRLDDA